MIKKISIIIILIFIGLSSGCQKKKLLTINFDYDGGVEDPLAKELYLPTPVKSNSVFKGWKVIGDYFNEDMYNTKESYLYDNITLDALKKWTTDYQLKLVAEFETISNDDLFEYVVMAGGYGVRAKELENFPREITVPETYRNENVTMVLKEGFKDLEELAIVNLPNTITHINEDAFSNTSLFKITNVGKAADNAFSNTLVDSLNKQKYKLNLIEESYQRKIHINEQIYTVDIDLDGGKFIEDEFNMCITMPIKEDLVFKHFEYEDQIIEFNYKKDINYMEYPEICQSISLYEYINVFKGKTLKAIWEPLPNDFYIYTYLETSDSYSVEINSNYRKYFVRKLTFPSMYQGKQITKIQYIYNDTLTEAIIPDSIIKISSISSKYLRKINLPNSLKDIFYFGDTALTSVNLPSGIEELYSSAFANTFIKSFTIPKTLLKIYGSAFVGCYDIKFYVEEGHPEFLVKDDNHNMVYSKDGSTLLLYSSKNDINNTLVIEENISKLGERVFASCYFKSIVLPNSLKEIGDEAFYNTEISSQLIIPEGVEILGASAFHGVNIKCGDKKIIFPSTLKHIKSYCFSSSNINEFDFKEGLEIIGDSAIYCIEFNPLNKLDVNVIIPSTIKEIDSNAIVADNVYFYGFIDIKQNIYSNYISSCSQPMMGNRIVNVYIKPEYMESMKEKILYYKNEDLNMDHVQFIFYELIIPVN